MIPKSLWHLHVPTDIYINPYTHMSTTTYTTIDDLFGSFYNILALEQDFPWIKPYQVKLCFHKCGIYTIELIFGIRNLEYSS